VLGKKKGVKRSVSLEVWKSAGVLDQSLNPENLKPAMKDLFISAD
jgi:hypothetical protein